MLNTQGQSIRGKFLRVTVPLISLTVICVFSGIELMTHRNSVNRLQQTLEGMIDTQSAALATPLWNLDHEQIELSLQAIVANREIVAARVYNEDGSLMRKTGQTEAPENLIMLQRDVLHDAGTGPKAIGKLEFVATRKYLWEQTRFRLFIAAIIVLLAVAIEIGAALFALRRIVGVPLKKLLSSINRAREGSEREKVDWTSSDELGQVITAFNEMQSRQEEYEGELRKARDSLEVRVDERTAELLAASKEATKARSQLTAAIETISEGFSLFDRDDKLVICNARYQELLRPEVDREIDKGTTFEKIVREAAEYGLIADAKGRVQEWIAERLEKHHNPGEPHLQHRMDNRWILVSERKTDDGGTVAVYADITDLKQSEQALAEKSNALERLSNQLSKYLSPQIYSSIFSGEQSVGITSKRKKLTVFFSDIVNFTETTDRLESEELTDLLNHYLTEMSRIALDYGATIDKYVGDAILAFFGDPESRGTKEDASACVEMAIAMQRRMHELRKYWLDLGFEKPFELRIGINTGYCTVGNFGSEDRMDYTIIGSEVNLASRLETSAEEGGILIASETYALVKDNILAEEQEPITAKGFALPVRVYKVIGIYDDLEQQGRIIREQQDGVKVLIDLSDKDSKKAIPVIEAILSELKR